MTIRRSLVALLACTLPSASLAQTPLGASELAKAKSMLDLYRAQLSAEQYALLSGKLAQTEQAYVELTTLAEVGAPAATVEAGAGASAATGGRAVLGGVVEVLPLLVFLWPATAHAPGLKEEKPEVRAAKVKLAKSVEELTAATRRVQDEQAAAAKQRKPKDSDKCGSCLCFYKGRGPEPGKQQPTREHCRRYCTRTTDGHPPANGMTCTGDQMVEWWN